MNRGTRVGRGYVDLEINGDGMSEDIVDAVDSAGPGVGKAGEEHGDRYGEGFEGGFFSRLRGRFQGGIARELQRRAGGDGRKTGDALGEGLIEGMRDRLGAGGFDFLRDKLIGDIDAIDDRMAELRSKLDRARAPASIERLNAALVEARKESTRLIGQLRTLAKQEARGVSGNIGDGRDEGVDISDRIGRLFGKGSRNNFLNLFGRTLSGLTGIMTTVTNAGVSMFRAFSLGFSGATEGASLLQKTLSGFGEIGLAGGEGLGKAFAAIASSGPAAAAAIAAVAAAMVILVSVASALLAIISALLATIVSGLVGALAVLGGAILAVVAAGGLLTAAFMSMSKEQKKFLKESFIPLADQMRGIGRIIISEMVPAFKIWSSNLQEALHLLAPFASTFGKAFAEAGTIFTSLLSGPSFQQFSQALGVYLPSIITNLSTALGQFLNGTLSVFAAIMPFVDQFAQHLANVATQFAAFASGTDGGDGPNRISNFVARAVESLKSLWGFLKQVSGLLGDIFFSPAAQNFGNGMFDGLAKSISNLRKNLTEAKLEKWFKDAEKFGRGLWSVLQGLLKIFEALYSSGVLAALGTGLRLVGSYFRVLASLVKVLMAPFRLMVALFNAARDALHRLSGTKFALNIGGPAGAAIKWLNRITGAANTAWSALQRARVAKAGAAIKAGALGAVSGSLVMDVLNRGSDVGAIGDYSVPSSGGGGGGGGGGSKKIKKSAKEIHAALVAMAASVKKGLAEAAKASDPAAVKDNLTSLISSMRATGKDLNTSARKKIEKAVSRVSAQRYTNVDRVDALLEGAKVANATLADYAAARQQIAAKIEAANTALTNAIALRDNYASSVEESTRSFAALTTAQAQTINGIEQALTSTDIASNLQDRLTKIQAFQTNLRILLAQGLNDSAYKQLVDAGVEGGSAYAQALVNGGPGAIGQVNTLVDQLDGVAKQLGQETSNRLYQAGVDAAQGLVDGLTSLSAQLDTAATRLGESIANAVKKSLGIHSPSSVMRDMMDYVGDGAVQGLDGQHGKVGAAAQRFSDQIAVSPEVAAYASRQGESPYVSGNERPIEIDVDIVTPTEDPHAVANEVINEIVGRLP